jgi:hypothetical protein
MYYKLVYIKTHKHNCKQAPLKLTHNRKVPSLNPGDSVQPSFKGGECIFLHKRGGESIFYHKRGE